MWGTPTCKEAGLKVLVDIGHPAHVHFYRHVCQRLIEAGHQVLVTSREKDCAVELLDAIGADHCCLSRQNDGRLHGMGWEYLSRLRALVSFVRAEKPDLLTGVGGIFAAHAGVLCRRPSVIFYDTEHATLQNSLTYPAATRLYVPDCYTAWTPSRRTVRYRGYHELAYLRPEYFEPSHEIAQSRCGLAAEGDTFLVRVVSWQANHDVGEAGWSESTLRTVVALLERKGRVIISTESPLPSDLADRVYQGRPEHLHHLLAFCRACIGESATLASESAVLGVPALYAAQVSRGYLDDIERRYGLVRVVGSTDPAAVSRGIEKVLALVPKEAQLRRLRLLEDTCDVTDTIYRSLTAFAS